MDHDYRIGDVLAGTPYRVVRHIATGGMGSVYEVVDASLGKRYALKTLPPDRAKDPTTIRRMRTEAQLLERLTHPNVVQVFTAGVTQDERRVPFFVMELLVGSTLRDLVRVRPVLGLPTAGVVTLELLGALDQAHELGLVHRDIKPDNVFLHRVKRGLRTTKLLDFGVADLVASANRDPNSFFGTFRYASPEQLRGLPISVASDLYAVGLLLFEMLAGAHPFSAARSRDEIAQAHLYEAPKVPASWPVAVRALLSSALAKDPSDRPRDAWTFASRLRRAMAQEGLSCEALETAEVSIAPPSTVDAARRLAQAYEDTQRDVTLDVTRRELLRKRCATDSPTVI